MGVLQLVEREAGIDETDARQAQERVYLDEIDQRFGNVPIMRVPQLPRDVHGIETLETIAAALFPG